MRKRTCPVSNAMPNTVQSTHFPSEIGQKQRCPLFGFGEHTHPNYPNYTIQKTGYATGWWMISPGVAIKPEIKKISLLQLCLHSTSYEWRPHYLGQADPDLKRAPWIHCIIACSWILRLWEKHRRSDKSYQIAFHSFAGRLIPPSEWNAAPVCRRCAHKFENARTDH